MKNPWRWMRSYMTRLVRPSPVISFAGTALVLGGSREMIPAAPEGWRLLPVRTMEEAGSLLDRQDVPVVLFDRETPGDWRRAVRSLAASRSHPSIVLLAPAGQQPGWDAVAAAGGYDILRKPVDAAALERTLRSARSHWRSRRALELASRPAVSTK